jgi:hypothetical protein
MELLGTIRDRRVLTAVQVFAAKDAERISNQPLNRQVAVFV